MSEPKPATVEFRSGTNATHPDWDVMQVVFKGENGGTVNHYSLGRDPAGNFYRRTDVMLDRWEPITDEDEVRICNGHYDTRDRLRAEEQVKKAGA
jgi:hypothetical protein